MLGQALENRPRKKDVEEELKANAALLRDAKKAWDTETQRRAVEDAADADIAAKSPAAGEPEPDPAPKLAKDEANDRKAAQLLDAFDTLKEDRLTLFEKLQTLQPQEERVYGMDELKQQKLQTRTSRIIALKQLAECQVPNATSAKYDTELDAYNLEKGKVSSRLQELQEEDDEIDGQMVEQSVRLDIAETQMSMVGHVDNDAERMRYDIARDRDRRQRKARLCSPGLRVLRGQVTPDIIQLGGFERMYDKPELGARGTQFSPYYDGHAEITRSGPAPPNDMDQPNPNGPTRSRRTPLRPQHNQNPYRGDGGGDDDDDGGSHVSSHQGLSLIHI